MYCRNCAAEMDPNAFVCVKCGYQKGAGYRYCFNCGGETDPGAAFCAHCGAALRPAQAYYPMQKSKIAAGVLGILLGSLGVHNFYLGYTGKAVAQLLITVLTLGLGSIISGVWGLIEGILILTGSIDCDAAGIPLRD
jgi:TM2 domain-containing membrane protein YozV/ribosomal protein L40E